MVWSVTVSITGLPSGPTIGLPSVPVFWTCCGSISFAGAYGPGFFTASRGTKNRAEKMQAGGRPPQGGAGHIDPEIADGLFFLAHDAANECDRKRNPHRRRREEKETIGNFWVD